MFCQCAVVTLSTWKTLNSFLILIVRCGDLASHEQQQYWSTMLWKAAMFVETYMCSSKDETLLLTVCFEICERSFPDSELLLQPSNNLLALLQFLLLIIIIPPLAIVLSAAKTLSSAIPSLNLVCPNIVPFNWISNCVQKCWPWNALVRFTMQKDTALEILICLYHI